MTAAGWSLPGHIDEEYRGGMLCIERRWRWRKAKQVQPVCVVEQTKGTRSAWPAPKESNHVDMVKELSESGAESDVLSNLVRDAKNSKKCGSACAHL